MVIVLNLPAAGEGSLAHGGEESASPQRPDSYGVMLPTLLRLMLTKAGSVRVVSLKGLPATESERALDEEWWVASLVPHAPVLVLRESIMEDLTSDV